MIVKLGFDRLLREFFSHPFFQIDRLIFVPFTGLPHESAEFFVGENLFVDNREDEVEQLLLDQTRTVGPVIFEEFVDAKLANGSSKSLESTQSNWIVEKMSDSEG
jgi:hypothetical protein